MIMQYEEAIVNAFVERFYRERVLIELSSKKRNAALWRLFHEYKRILTRKYLFEIPRPGSDAEAMAELLQSNGAGGYCYVISMKPGIDGMEMPLLAACRELVGYGLPCIISCIPGELAYFEPEQDFGPLPKFLLKREA